MQVIVTLQLLLWLLESPHSEGNLLVPVVFLIQSTWLQRYAVFRVHIWYMLTSVAC